MKQAPPARLFLLPLILSILLLAACTSQPTPSDPLPAGLTEEATYWWNRALARTPRNPSPAILVSRYAFGKLRPLESWQDLDALRNYVDWADRAEAAGFDGAQVTADVSANDLILLRLPAASIKASVSVKADPIGFAVLDPGATGQVRIPIERTAHTARIPDLPRDLPLKPVPIIEAAVAAEPLIVVLYGSFAPATGVKAVSPEGAAEILYASATQINLRFDQPAAKVQVEVDGMRSEWVEVER